MFRKIAEYIKSEMLGRLFFSTDPPPPEDQSPTSIYVGDVYM